MNPTDTRPQVHFAEPRDVSFSAELAQQGFQGSSTSALRSEGELAPSDYSYEAIALVVMGVGLFILALTIVIARAIKSHSQ